MIQGSDKMVTLRSAWVHPRSRGGGTVPGKLKARSHVEINYPGLVGRLRQISCFF